MKTIHRLSIVCLIIVVLFANTSAISAQDNSSIEGLSWSTDSQYVFVSFNGDIYAFAPDGSGVKVVAGGSSTVERLPQSGAANLFFVTGKDGATEIGAVKNGGEADDVTVLTSKKLTIIQVSASPTGDQVAYAAFDASAQPNDTDIFIQSADGEIRVTQTPNWQESYPAWSWDGKISAHIAIDYANNLHKICFVDPLKLNRTKKCFDAKSKNPRSDGTIPMTLSFSHDNKWVTYLAAVKANTNEYGVYVMNVSNGQVKLLTPMNNDRLQHLTAPSWDTQGRVVYAEFDAVNSTVEIFAINPLKQKLPTRLATALDDSELGKLTGVTYAAVSPDGKWFAIVGQSDDGDKVCFLSLTEPQAKVSCPITSASFK